MNDTVLTAPLAAATVVTPVPVPTPAPAAAPSTEAPATAAVETPALTVATTVADVIHTAAEATAAAVIGVTSVSPTNPSGGTSPAVVKAISKSFLGNLLLETEHLSDDVRAVITGLLAHF